MNKREEVFMRIREWYRKNSQTNWGKNQIIKNLDEMEEVMISEEFSEEQSR